MLLGAEWLQKENLTQNVMFFNQNDLPGYKFTIDIAKDINLKEYKSINYDVIDEYKKDINDVLIDGEKIADRITDCTLGQREKICNSLEALKNIQKEMEKPRITRDDLKQANQQQQEQNRGYERY